MREEHRKPSLEAPRAGSIPGGICAKGGEGVTDYLPEIYQHFERRYPTVKEAFDALGAAEHEAGPLDDKERRLIKLGIAVGAESEGGVRSHVRKLLGVGASEEEILHAIVLALTTIGFPATNAALSWAEEVLAEEANGK
jgi:alkylhydroperoxidase/carboxymuconolactone decarboxylase family protein YurZ